MKKIKRYITAVAFIVSLLCLALGLVACDKEPALSGLRVENARVSFMRGDEFETGEDFTVIAVYDDGTEKDVTAEAAIRQESGMDMNVPGNYQITVSWGKKKEIYTVYVNDAEDVLRKIELDTTNVKKTYELGDSVSFDDLLLKLTYVNSQGVTFSVETKSLKGFDVEIRNGSGALSGNVFNGLGDFTVTVSKGAVKASYGVNVAGINISTVQGAITVGSFYKNRVVSGEALVKERISVHALSESFRYQYEYGDNYTRFSDVLVNPANTYHCSVDEGGIFIVREQQGGKIVTNDMSHPDMMNGSPYLLWYYQDTVYGIESVLNNLYERARACSNHDLKESADEATRTYSFSFTGLEQSTNDFDYFETTVAFTLSEDYTIAAVEYEQKYYENNSAWEEGERTFITDPATGKTEPVGRPSHYTIVTVSQTAGERTAKNHYSRDMFKIASFDLKYGDRVLENGDVLECDVATKTYLLTVENVLPDTADFTQDPVYIDYEGNRGGPDTWLNNEHFTIIRTESGIQLTVRHGGKWTLYFTTEKVKKTLTIDVTGANPTSITPQLWNAASGSFYSGGSKILALNGEAYFYGAVNAYANAAQTVEITSGNRESVILTETQIGGIECYKFSASEAGAYEVTITSSAAPSLSCTVTFTVSDAVDFDALLRGSYTTQDSVGNLYTLIFDRADGDGLIKGTVSVTKTPTDGNDMPIGGEAVSQTLAFYVDDMAITVEHGDSDKIWIELEINEENELMLVDQGNRRFKLVRVPTE